MKIEEKYPEAWQFLGAYYNQDFIEIFGGVEETLSAFLNDTNNEERTALKRDIELIMQEGLTEEDLESLLADLGCEYYPPDDWPSSAAWLRHILSRLG